ncbi:Smr/MutS family protein [Motiliproteus sediminis]|uniref:Smr/MutS family protein n=1 Tax=Motiliproteus sediminis TaxID=1468178 RepID=UPI001AF001FA|nr:Smr/MutS family protein [Motiliproteus sediminis]
MAPKQQNTTDDADFASLVGEVKRHHHDRADLRTEPKAVGDSIDYRREAATREQEGFSDGLSDRLSTLVDSEEELIFAVPGVQQRLLQRMKQGHLPWEAGLDLHGYSVDEARDQLSSFIRDALRQGLRCVIVVHGKAANTEGRQPLLKSYVNDWLRQIPQVLAFVSSQPQDGGTGALYVLLKRHR